MNWKGLFTPRILQRGLEYCRNLAVEDLHITDEQITASVLGTEKYAVEIDIKNDAIEAMSCTCPYAADGNTCKHMAAVLFACEDTAKAAPAPADDEDGDSSMADWNADVRASFREISASTGSENKLAAAITETDERMLRAILYIFLKEDPALQSRFQTLSAPVMAPGTLRQWKGEADRIIADAAYDTYDDDYDDEEEYEEDFPDFTSDLYSFLSSLSSRISPSTAPGIFETVAYTLSRLLETGLDNAYGGLWCLYDLSYEIVGKLLPYCSEKDRLRIFDWAARQLDTAPSYGQHELGRDRAMQFIMQHFLEPEFLDKKLDLTEKEAKKAAQTSSAYRQSRLVDKLKAHVFLMEQKGCSVAEQAAYMAQYRQYGSVCLLLGDFYEWHQDDNNAIAVLEGACAADIMNSNVAQQCCEKLKDLYKKAGKKEEYLHMLWKLVLEMRAADIALYRELKSQYRPEEWNKLREKILVIWGTNPYAAQLYVEEKLYDRLLRLVQKHRRLSEIEQYEDILKKTYPAELLQLYEDMAVDMAAQNLGRPAYVKIVRFLNKMKELPGGPLCVQGLVNQWRRQYKRRRAMMEELDKLQ